MRDHSSLELRDKLAERGCDKELQDRVLAALRERHFVDDVRCAGYVVDAWRRKASMDEITFGSCLKNGRSRHLS